MAFGHILLLLLLGLVAFLVVLRTLQKKVSSILNKAGVQVSCGGLGSNCVNSLTVSLSKGPLQRLTIDRIAWRSAAAAGGRSSETSDSSTAAGSSLLRGDAGPAWLPVRISGVHLVISSSAGRSKGSSRKKRKHKASSGPGAWSASSILALAKRLLPHVPVRLQDVTMELKGPGVTLQLKRAALQWAVQEEHSALTGSLLLQEAAIIVAGAVDPTAAAAAAGTPPSTGLHCPAVQVSCGVAASKGPLPISCSKLSLQVGLIRASGISQLLLLAAAAAAPRCKAQAAGKLASPGAPAAAAAKSAGRPPPLPEQLLKVVALLPDKLKLACAGVQLVELSSEAAAMAPLQQLPQLLGSVGAITLGSSSCQQPSAVGAGGKLLNLQASMGPIQLSAAAAARTPAAAAGAADHPAGTGSGVAVAAAEFSLAGVSVTADVSKAATSTSTSKARTWHIKQRLQQQFAQQQQQQQQQLKARCTCMVAERPQLQLHAQQLPALADALQLLQQALLEIKQCKAAAAAAVAAAEAAGLQGLDEQEQLWLGGTLSPAVSVASLPRPDTPGLAAAGSSELQSPASSAAGLQAAAGADTRELAAAAAVQGADAPAPATADAAAGDGAPVHVASTAGDAAGSAGTRFPKWPGTGGRAPAAAVGLLLELEAGVEEGVSLEVLDESGAVLMWLAVQRLAATGSAEWSPGSQPGSGTSLASQQQQQQQGLVLSAALSLQQLAVRLAPLQPARPRPALHQLLLLDTLDVELRSSSAEASPEAPPAAAAGADASAATAAVAAASPQMVADAAVIVGHVALHPSSSSLAALLQLAELLYAPQPRLGLSRSPSCRLASAAGAQTQLTPAASSGGSSAGFFLQQQQQQQPPKKKSSKHKLVLVTVVDVSLQKLCVTYTSPLPLCPGFATDAAGTAATAGLESQLLLTVSSLQLCLQPTQQQLAASLQQLQLGFRTQGAAAQPPPQLQSVELLLLSRLDVRRYASQHMQLLKAAVQQVRSDLHVDAAIAASGMAEQALQAAAGCLQRLQACRAVAAGAAAVAARQVAVRSLVAAAAGQASGSSSGASAGGSSGGGLGAALDSFSLLARGLPPVEDAAALAALPEQAPAADDAAGVTATALPPLARVGSGSSSSWFLPSLQQPPQQRVLQQPDKDKPALTLEVRLQDVAVQAWVCERDVLLVQLELVKYSSVLEQLVAERLRFAINERTVVQVPHLALHQLPGWQPGGASAAFAACSATQRASSPMCGSSVSAAAAAALAAGEPGRGRSVGLGSPGPAHDRLPSFGRRSSQQFDCGASTESVRFHDDGGVQVLDSVDEPVPSASLGSRRPSVVKEPGVFQRQAARQQAARERCKVPQAATAAAGDAAAAGQAADATRSKCGQDGGGEGSGAVAAPLLTLEVYAEQVLFCVPHDEAPGRIILVCETWAKAVKQVIAAQARSIKQHVTAIKLAKAALRSSTGSSSASTKPPRAKRPKPAYIELVAHVQQLVFSMEQHPLETFMGLHGPLLQLMAAERHLTEQLLSSCATSHGRIRQPSARDTALAAPQAAPTGRRAKKQQLQQQQQQQQRQQFQKRRWGSLGRRGNSLTAAIGAGSVSDAAAAAVAGPGAAALAALSGPVPGPLAAPPLAPLAAGALAPAAGSPPEAAGLGSDTPATPDTATAAANAAGATAALLDAAADGETERDVVLSDSSDELDSSDEEDAAGLLDRDSLAAGLPDSASVLAAEAAAGPSFSAAAGAAGTDAGMAAGEAGTDGAAQPAAAASSEMQRAVLEAHCELFSMYKSRCRPLAAAAADAYHPSGAVMHVSAARAEAVVLICLPGNPESAAMASEVITRVDPASEGVVMERCQSISLDVGMQELLAHFGGVEEMASSIGSLGASGLLVRARQLAAPPQTRPLRMAVGSWHAADVPVVVKGTRPPMKMYTDMRAELDDVQGGFCPGLEAPFGQLNLAFKRLTVPNALNADGSVPPSVHPGLPWWDMMRYMWRGVAAVRINRLTAILANSQNPHVGIHHPKLALTATTLTVAVAAGRIDVTSTNMSACAHAVPPVAVPGDSLLLLPAFHLPQVRLGFQIGTKMLGGRNPLLHHAFPVLSAPPPPGSPPQEFVDVFSLMRCEGWTLGIDISVCSDRTPAMGTGSGSGGGACGPGTGGSGAGTALGCSGAGAAGPAAAAAAASCWHYFQPYRLPHAYIGEFQMKYIIDMVDTLANPSAVVRLSRKLKPFHVRDRRPEAAAAARAVAAVRSQILAMPMLKQRVDICLTADVFRVHHDAQDSEDPSDLLYLALSSVRYMNTFSYSRYKRTQVLSGGSRLKDSMRQFMASLSVEAFDLRVIKPQADELAALLASAPAAGPAPGAWGIAAGATGLAGGGGVAQDQSERLRQPDPGKASARAAAATPATLANLVSPGSITAPTRQQSQPQPQPQPQHASQQGNGREEDAATSDLPGFTRGLIIDAACFLLRQAPPEPGSTTAAAAVQASAASAAIPVDPPPVPKRPIRMIAQDVKLLCPAELRDTCILLFYHMQKAFSGISFGQPQGPVRISTRKQQQQQADSTSNSPRIQRTGSGGSTPTSLSKSSVGAGQLASADAAPPDAAATAAGSSSMVMTPLEEEMMLQRILQENRAAAAAAAAAASRQSKQRSSSDDLATRSTGGSASARSAAGEPPGLDLPGDTLAAAAAAAGGAGHAAVAARAVSGGGRLAAAGSEEEEQASLPRSQAESDASNGPAQGSDGVPGSPSHQQEAEMVLLEYEIEFVQVQVNLVSDSARGNLVLGTNSALLMGHLNPARAERSVSFKMDQVQAHVACSEPDPQLGPLWLEIANGKLSTPAGADGIMRQVLLPFKCQLVTTKQALNVAATARNNAAPGASSSQGQQQQLPGQRRSSSSGLPPGPAGAVPAAAQELRVHVPVIGARLDSRQFEVLMDVIQNIAAAPLPTFPPSIRGMWQHPDGMTEDDDNQDVQYALETLQSLRERQKGLEHELAALLQAQQYEQLQQQQQQQPRSMQQLAVRLQGSQLASNGSAVSLSGWGDSAASCYADSECSSVVGRQLMATPRAAGWGTQQPYADIREATTALLLALAAAGSAAERPWQAQLQQAQQAGAASPSNLVRQHQQRRASQQDELVLVQDRQTLIWWAQEQLQGALDAIAATRVVLELLRNEAGLLKVRQRNAMIVSITVDTIDWALGKGSTVIVQGELQGILYQSVRDEDHTGTTKIQLYTATFRDPQQQAAAAAAAAAAASKLQHQQQHTGTGELPALPGSDGRHHGALPTGSSASSAAAAAPGAAPQGAGAAVASCSTPREQAAAELAAAEAAEAGVILAPMYLDESYKSEELVLIVAEHGALEKRHVVYEHIEVTVQPIRIHLTAALASALQDYFHLREEDSKALPAREAKQQQAAAKAAAAAEAGGRGSKQTDKRRQTAPGDLPLSGPLLASLPPASGSSIGSPAGGGRRPSIFNRRQAAAQAAAATAAAAQQPEAAAATQLLPPMIAVPLNEFESGAQPVGDPVAAAAATGVGDSPSLEVSIGGHLPAQAAAADGGSSGSGGGAAADEAPAAVAAAASQAQQQPPQGPGLSAAAAGVRPHGGSASVDEAMLLAHAAAAAQVQPPSSAAAGPLVALPSPGSCVQLVSASEALAMRYGSVVRSRAGRAAGGAATPGTPGSSTAAGVPTGAGPASGGPGSGAVCSTPGPVAIAPGGAFGGGGAAANVAGLAAAAGPAGGAGSPAMPPPTPAGASAGPSASSSAAAGGGGTAAAGAAGGGRRAVPVRGIKFRHVRFNRLYARVTWEGPPLSISNFGLVLDNRVYRNIDGGWTSVLNRWKWDAVRSLIKSLGGLQARKLQELNIPHFGADSPESMQLRPAGIRAGLMALLKGRKGTRVALHGGGEAGSSLTAEEGAGFGGLGEQEGGGEGGAGGPGALQLARAAGGAEAIDLARDLALAKHKARRVALILGNVPLLPVAVAAGGGVEGAAGLE